MEASGVGSWLIEDPVAREVAATTGERVNRLGFQCCVSSVKFPNFPGLPLPPIHSPVTGSLGGLSVATYEKVPATVPCSK